MGKRIRIHSNQFASPIFDSATLAFTDYPQTLTLRSLVLSVRFLITLYCIRSFARIFRF